MPVSVKECEWVLSMGKAHICLDSVNSIMEVHVRILDHN